MDFEPYTSKSFDSSSSEKSDSSFNYAQPDPQFMGRKLKMRFDTGNQPDHPQYEWYSGQILNFDPTTGKYGVFFPIDKQTVFIDPIERAEDIKITP